MYLKIKLTNADKFKLKIESKSGEQTGDGEFPILVKLSHNPSANYRLLLYGGTHGRGHLTLLRGHIYEGGPIHESQVPFVYLAHQAAHLMLGADDQYAPQAYGRTVYTDNSLMGNFYREGFAAAEIKARHYYFLLPLLQPWLPDVTIQMVAS